MQKTITKSKGEIMLEKAEDVSQFWAYDLSFSKDSDLTLLDNVQFIYELSLSELELLTLGADFEVTNGLREFKLKNKSKELNDRIIKCSSYLKTFEQSFTNYFMLSKRKEHGL